MAMEMDDDVFFADLSKQLALLIMDDDEEFAAQRASSAHVQSFSYAPQAIMPPQFVYDLASRRESKGTGVFIPRSSCPRRKNRSGRPTSMNNNSHRQSYKSGISHPRAMEAANRASSNAYYGGPGAPKRQL